MEWLTGQWAVHVEGPDDILAMPDRMAAELKAIEINAAVAVLGIRGPLDPHIHAEVVEWAGTAEEHAASLGFGLDYTP